MDLLVDCGYKNFTAAQQQIGDVVAIDFYLAKQLVNSINAAKNISSDNRFILLHCIMYLNLSIREGHTCLPIKQVAGLCWGKAQDVDQQETHQGFTFPNLVTLTTLAKVINCEPNNQQPLVYWQNSFYLRRYFTFEQELSQLIASKLALAKYTDYSAISSCLQQLFDINNTNNGNQLDWQMISVANALNKKFSVIAGGPGTGKTYTVTKLLAGIIFLAQQEVAQTENEHLLLPRIALVAPTGKAAQRLSESINKSIQQFRGKIADSILEAIPHEAQTIHRLLGVIPNQNQFQHHQKNKLMIDVLLIDESSMVDLALMTRLFRAINDNCQVILLGDADQLPSVLSGNVLSELSPRIHVGYSADNIKYLQSVLGKTCLLNHQSKVPYCYDYLTVLVHSRRFDGKGGIGRLANAVITGNSGLSWQLLTDDKVSQINIMSGEPAQFLIKLVKQYYLPIFNSASIAEAFYLFSQFRILCATKQGNSGVYYFNELITSLLIDSGIKASHDQHYHGQPIMIEENNYQMGLYNGDVGFIWQDKNGHLMAVFENDTTHNRHQNKDNLALSNDYRFFMLSQLPKHNGVYAMTIHKTQGSEFNHVLMVLPEQADHQLLSRELIYTGITRAKLLLSIVSKTHIWQQAVEQKVKRYANLGYSLITKIQP